MTEIIFIGGIHGSGKGTICSQLCDSIGATHLIASELLKWEDISKKHIKSVVDIPNTQERLLEGLKNTIKDNHRYILDGHFCLFDKELNISRISFNVFREISPSSIYVLIEDIEMIADRLFRRDGVKYHIQKLKKMQEEEDSYGKEIADKLSIKYTKFQASEIHKLIKILK